MFTADGLRPDSPHLVPPRGAAFVLFLSLSLSPSVPLPSLPRSSCFRPSYSQLSCFLAFALSSCPSLLLFLSCRPFRVYSTLSLRLASFHELLTLLAPLYPRHDYPTAKGGESLSLKRECISRREKTDDRKRQWYRGTRGGNHIYMYTYILTHV